MTLRERIYWHWLDYPIMTSTYLFNHRICYGLHFPKCGSLSIELYFDGGTIGLSHFRKNNHYKGKRVELWTLDKYLNDKIAKGTLGKLRSVTIRLGRPIISFYISNEHRAKSLAATRRLQISF